MPPHSSLPLRDGRLGSSSLLSGGREHYYTNEEIELIHKIVIEAEDILPTLPERERLPTNALFRAVETILPQYGYDPDDVPPPISRLIFKIGGLRGDGQLMDRFRTILGKMGIELEIVQPNEAGQTSPSPEPPSPVSPPSPHGSADQTGTFPLSANLNGRRRRNSDSIAHFDTQDRMPLLAPLGRARSVSFSTSNKLREEALNVARGDDGRGGQAPTLPSWSRRNDAAGSADGGSDGDVKSVEADSLGQFDHTDAVHDEYLDLGAIPFRPRPRPGRYDLEYGHEHGTSPSTAAGTGPMRFSPHSRVDSGDYFRGASDTTVHTFDDEPESPPPRSTEIQLEKLLVLYHHHIQTNLQLDCIKIWRDKAKYAEGYRQAREARADEFDMWCTWPEALDIWDERATDEEQDRLDAEIVAQEEAHITKMEQRAARAYEFYIMDKALSHWAVCANEEAERTMTARRHILRKRIFGAWRAQRAKKENKVLAFAVNGSLACWNTVATDLEKESRRAVKKYEDDIVRITFKRWLNAHLSCLADRMASAARRKHCIAVWIDHADRQAKEYDVARNYAKSGMISRALSDWAAVTKQQRQLERAGQQTLQGQDTWNIMVDWQKYSTLTMLLRRALAARNDRLTIEAIETWSTRTRQAVRLSNVADAFASRGFVKTWIYQTRLKMLVEHYEGEIAAETIYFWYLAEKLAFFKRYSDQRLVRHSLESMAFACDTTKAASDEALQKAERLDVQHTTAWAVGVWKSLAEWPLVQEQNAFTLSTYHTARRCVEVWSAKLAQVAIYYEWADRGAYFCAVFDALDWWEPASRRAKEERLTRTYHAFRSPIKTSMAIECILAWRAATEDAIAAGWEAEQISDARDEEETADVIQFWDAYAENQQLCMSIARDADLEVVLRSWAAAAEELYDLDLDAIDEDTEHTLNRCWESWELASMQLRGRQYTIAELQDKNDKKLCQQLLVQWLQRTHLDMLQDDLRSSHGSRRSGRLGGTPRHVATSGLESSVSESRYTAPVQQLSRISEKDEVPRASPRRPVDVATQYGQLASRAGGRGALPVGSSPPPSTSLTSSRYPYRREIGETPQPLRPGLSLGDDPLISGTRLGSSILQGRTSSPYKDIYGHPVQLDSSTAIRGQGLPYPETPYATAASQFESSVPLGPMSEFDEEFWPDAEVATGVGDPAFLTTPTRWAGNVRSFGYGQRPTTTPLAPLPKPYEMILGEGGSGGGSAPASSARVGQMGRQTARVTFSEMREEKGTEDAV